MQKKMTIFLALFFGLSLAFYCALPSEATAKGQDKNAKGRQLYITYCASCHGVDGKGGGPAASALKVSLSDLTRIPQQDGKFPIQRIQRIIGGDDVVSGHGNREMPVWGDYFRKTRDGSVSKLNVYALTKYIESIQAK